MTQQQEQPGVAQVGRGGDTAPQLGDDITTEDIRTIPDIQISRPSVTAVICPQPVYNRVSTTATATTSSSTAETMFSFFNLKRPSDFGRDKTNGKSRISTSKSKIKLTHYLHQWIAWRRLRLKCYLINKLHRRLYLSYLLMRSVFYSSLTESAEWAAHKYDNSSPQVSANKDPVDTSLVFTFPLSGSGKCPNSSSHCKLYEGGAHHAWRVLNLKFLTQERDHQHPASFTWWS